MSKNTNESSRESAKLLWFTLKSDFPSLRAHIESESFVKHDAELFLALCMAIQRNEYEMVKYFTWAFNLDLKNEKIILVAAEADIKIWKIFEEMATTWQVKFTKHTHPLVVSFRAGNYEVAKSMRTWDKNHPGLIPQAVVEHAIYEAAEMGHVEICKLYTVRNEYMALVVKSLVKNGHADKVKCLVRTPMTDFSYNNFEMLRTCYAHFDAMCAILRHPSVEKNYEQLPDYYKYARVACKGDWKLRQKAHLDALSKVLKEKIAQKTVQGLGESFSTDVSKMEMSSRILAHLTEHDLNSYTYVFK